MCCDKSAPLVSIIVPVYNVEEYLKECIDSIVDQTYKNLEIILIDDHSTDRSFDICKEYEKAEPNITAYTNDYDKKGVSSARNFGIQRANGKYICFVDADDILSPNYVFNLMSMGEKSKGCHVLISYKSFRQTEELKTIKTNNKGRPQYQKIPINTFISNQMFYLTVWSGCYNTEILRKYRIFFCEDAKYSEDIFFVLKYLSIKELNIQTVVLSSEEDYYYRRRQGSGAMKRDDRKYTLDDLMHRLTTLNAYNDAKPFIINQNEHLIGPINVEYCFLIASLYLMAERVKHNIDDINDLKRIYTWNNIIKYVFKSKNIDRIMLVLGMKINKRITAQLVDKFIA